MRVVRTREAKGPECLCADAGIIVDDVTDALYHTCCGAWRSKTSYQFDLSFTRLRRHYGSLRQVISPFRCPMSPPK